jgi:hypothetical protein
VQLYADKTNNWNNIPHPYNNHLYQEAIDNVTPHDRYLGLYRKVLKQKKRPRPRPWEGGGKSAMIYQ